MMNGFMMNTTGSLVKDDISPLRRSSNVTESVPVPSSEHVAEIVGRQGCKIKALRAKTNTYIKTPVRDEEPVFVVTGRKEDVAAAMAEIISAADHFSQIRAARRPGGVGPGSPNIPGQVKLNVPVPYRVVGLLVGSKGATIKKIQQKTSTYIVTPSREKEPMFEVTGQEENVYQARALMYYHIFERTGQLCDPKYMGDIGQLDLLNGINADPLLNRNQQIKAPPPMNSFSADSLYEDPMSALAALNSLNGALMNPKVSPDFSLQNAIKTMNMTRSMMNNGGSHHIPDPLHLPGGQGLKPVDEGISLSPPMTSTCFWSTDDYKGTGLQNNTNSNPTSKACPLQRKVTGMNPFPSLSQQSLPLTCSPTSTTTTDKFLATSVGGVGYSSSMPSSAQNRNTTTTLPPPLDDNQLGYNSLSALTSALVPMTLNGGSGCAGGGTSSAADSVAGSLVSTPDTSPMTGIPSHFLYDSSSSSTKKYCLVCLKNEVTGAFLPCGHNHFCTDCAELVLKKSELERKCPYCQEQATQFFKIYT